METLKQDFYVQQGCCVSCGVPQTVAPTLVGWREVPGLTECYWIRQPRTSDELEQAIRIIHEQELGCHRYAGTDPKVVRRLPAAQCDFPSLGLFDSLFRWFRLFRSPSTDPVACNASPVGRRPRLRLCKTV